MYTIYIELVGNIFKRGKGNKVNRGIEGRRKWEQEEGENGNRGGGREKGERGQGEGEQGYKGKGNRWTGRGERRPTFLKA